MGDPVGAERVRRAAMWRKLAAIGPKGAPARLLRDLGVYGGTQGVWVNKKRTRSLTEDGSGVTVGLLRAGAAHADDLSEDVFVCQYPETNRPGGRDRSEIESTKAAGRLGLPVFVISYPAPASTKRHVRLGWVEDWDDESRRFLICFREAQPLRQEDDEGPFELTERGERAPGEGAKRKGQLRFKFRVFKRYGPSCAACGLRIAELLDAAHIRPTHERGSDDPRNGLVLCALHHRAFDAGLFSVNPRDWRIQCRASGGGPGALRITHTSLLHLAKRPHVEAVAWHWERWRGDSSRWVGAGAIEAKGPPRARASSGMATPEELLETLQERFILGDFSEETYQELKANLLARQGAAEPAPTICEWDDLLMVLVPAGEFQRGSQDGEDDERPIHTVRLSAYHIGKYPVTNAQYGGFVQDTGHRGPEDYGDKFARPAQPVVGVSWDDAVAFCRWLSRKTGKPYRLPTGAEWERAARGTDGRRYPWGEQEPDRTLCNFDLEVGCTTPVGGYPLGASPCGCRDMAGNVWEWCLDWHGPYPAGPLSDPQGPASGQYRVLRGGSWYIFGDPCRSAYRGYSSPADRDSSIGFRVARPLA